MNHVAPSDTGPRRELRLSDTGPRRELRPAHAVGRRAAFDADERGDGPPARRARGRSSRRGPVSRGAIR